MRKLASIQKIIDIQPIEGADKIEVAKILGWQCVVKKGEFKVNDLIIYVEIDSILPEKPEFEFMRDRKFKVKSIKLRGQISQGLVLPLSILPKNKTYVEDQDVTEVLGIVKFDPDKENESKPKEKKMILPWFLRPFKNQIKSIKWLRKLFMKAEFHNKSFPRFIHKTDETRIQSIFNSIIPFLEQGRLFYITQKLEGTSATYYKKDNMTGVCSRSVEYYTKNQKTFHGDNVYHQINEKYQITKKLKQYDNNIAIQGEIIGPNVACGVKGATGITELDFFVYNAFDIDRQVYLNYEQLVRLCRDLSLKMVPIVDDYVDLSGKKLEDFLELAKGTYNFNGKNDLLQEGIVIRPIYELEILGVGRFSFKVINNDYLLKYKV